MSNLHCKLNFIGDYFTFEDMASTNGSWLRLSKEAEESKVMPITHGSFFKIGSTAIYEVVEPVLQEREQK